MSPSNVPAGFVGVELGPAGDRVAVRFTGGGGRFTLTGERQDLAFLASALLAYLNRDDDAELDPNGFIRGAVK